MKPHRKIEKSVTRRFLPNIRQKGVLWALVFGIFLSVPGVIRRTFDPAPTKTEQHARQRKQFEFILIAMVVHYLRYELKKRGGYSHMVRSQLEDSMEYLLKQCCPKNVVIITTESDILFLIDFILSNMDEQERKNLVNDVSNCIEKLSEIVYEISQMDDPQARETYVKEYMTREFEKVGATLMVTIQRVPGLKTTIEQMFSNRIKIDTTLFATPNQRC